MLLNDKKRRNLILNFISKIPFDLRFRISNLLKQYGEYRMNILDDYSKITDDNKLYTEVEEYGKYLYWASISLEDGMLSIGVKKKDNDLDFFEISLIPDLFLNYYKLKSFDKFLIGKFSYSISDKNDSGEIYPLENDSVKYNLIHTPLGALLEYNTDLNIFSKKFVPTRIKKMPKHLNIYSVANSRRFH